MTANGSLIGFDSESMSLQLILALAAFPSSDFG
jgi:hypothetical protein